MRTVSTLRPITSLGHVNTHLPAARATCVNKNTRPSKIAFVRSLDQSTDRSWIRLCTLTSRVYTRYYDTPRGNAFAESAVRRLKPCKRHNKRSRCSCRTRMRVAPCLHRATSATRLPSRPIANRTTERSILHRLNIIQLLPFHPTRNSYDKAT